MGIYLAAVAARLRLSSAEWGLLARMPQPDMVWADMDSGDAFDPRNSFAEHFSFKVGLLQYRAHLWTQDLRGK